MLGFVLIAASPVWHNAVFPVNGQNLHILVGGKGAPAVVFEAGQGNGSTTWLPIAGTVARFTQVVVYDRAGLGQSLPLAHPSIPVTANAVAVSLHTLLKKAGVEPSFILVGHSLGGLYVQMFARLYPREVAGVVLIDSASADAPPDLKTRARLEPGTPAYLEEAGIKASDEDLQHAGPFPEVPLTVIAATDHGPFFKSRESLLMQLQRRLVKLSPQGRLVIARGSGHYVQNDQPDLVISAIRSMVQKAIPNSH